MKKIFLFFVLLLLSFQEIAIAQCSTCVILKKKDTWNVIVQGQTYKRGYLGSYFSVSPTHDSMLTVNYVYGYPVTIFGPLKFNKYLDGDNSDSPFHTQASLKVWLDSNFYSKSTSVDSTKFVTYTTLNDSLFTALRKKDSLTLYTTINRLKDSLLTRVKYRDSTIRYITPHQFKHYIDSATLTVDSTIVALLDTLLNTIHNQKVSYTDSGTVYVTPFTLDDSMKVVRDSVLALGSRIGSGGIPFLKEIDSTITSGGGSTAITYTITTTGTYNIGGFVRPHTSSCLTSWTLNWTDENTHVQSFVLSNSLGTLSSNQMLPFPSYDIKVLGGTNITISVATAVCLVTVDFGFSIMKLN